MSEFLKTLADRLKEDSQAPVEDLAPFPHQSLQDNPKVREILNVLEKSPLLVQPTLLFVRQKEAEVAEATLVALYGRDQYELMKAAELNKSQS